MRALKIISKIFILIFLSVLYFCDINAPVLMYSVIIFIIILNVIIIFKDRKENVQTKEKTKI